MIRTAGELKKFLDTIPDSEELSFYHGGLTCWHESLGEFGNEFGSYVVTGTFTEDNESSAQ